MKKFGLEQEKMSEDAMFIAYLLVMMEEKTWENSGLKKSEHISKIIVHSRDPNTIWVAVRNSVES